MKVHNPLRIPKKIRLFPLCTLSTRLTCYFDVQIGIQKQIFSFQIAMNNVPAVTKIYGCDDLLELATGFLLCHSTVGHQVVCAGEGHGQFSLWKLVKLTRYTSWLPRLPTNERIKEVKTQLWFVVTKTH